LSFNYTLLDSFSLDGRWGLAGWEQEKWLPGRLAYDPENGIRLEVLGLFEDIKAGPIEVPPEREVIQGVTGGADLVTLFKCVSSGLSMSFSPKAGAAGARYQAHWMVVGEHLSSLEEARYSSLSVNLHNLEEFIGRTGFQSNSTAEGVSVVYKFPEPLEMQIDKFAAKAEYSAHLDSKMFEQMGIAQRGWLTFTPEAETHFQEFLTGPLASLHYLLTFALGHRAPIIAVEAKTPRTAISFEGKELFPALKLFFRQKHALPLPDREHPLRFLFTLAGLGDGLSGAAINWQKGFNAFRDALDFYFSIDPESDTDVALEHHFLSVMDALESYHRRVGKNQLDLLPESAHEARLKTVLESAPLEHRDWLKNKLQYGNEVSLRSRVKELYDEQPANVKDLLGKKSQFAGAVIDTRNYLIHHSPELKASALSGSELWLATKKVRLVLQACFLRQMGLLDDAISGAIARSRDYLVLRQHSKKGNSNE